MPAADVNLLPDAIDDLGVEFPKALIATMPARALLCPGWHSSDDPAAHLEAARGIHYELRANDIPVSIALTQSRPAAFAE